MDPKTMPNLDPKLRETYERVMGTTLKPSTVDKPKDDQKPTSPPPASPTAAQPHKAEAVSAAAIAQMGQTQHETPPPPKSSLGTTTPLTGTVRLDATNEAATHPVKEKKKTKISPIFFVLGGVVFFVVYALFWAKVLNLPLPF